MNWLDHVIRKTEDEGSLSRPISVGLPGNKSVVDRSERCFLSGDGGGRRFFFESQGKTGGGVPMFTEMSISKN